VERVTAAHSAASEPAPLPPAPDPPAARAERHAQVIDFEARRQWRVCRLMYAAMTVAMDAAPRPGRRRGNLRAVTTRQPS
jgi:hypothetical protein